MPSPFADARARIRHATLDPNARDPDAEIRRAFGPLTVPQVEPAAEQTEPPRPPGRPTEKLQRADGRPAEAPPKPVAQLRSGLGRKRPLTPEEAFRKFILKALD
jgi:hypothetical protein